VTDAEINTQVEAAINDAKERWRPEASRLS
jgi:hypothetical protein